MNPLAIFVLILGISIGLAILGLALRTMRLEREKQAAEGRRPEEKPAAAPPQPASSGAPDLPEMARLLRDTDGSLIVEVGGRRYRDRLEIRDSTVGRQLLATLDDFHQFLRGASPRPAPAPPAAADRPKAPPFTDDRNTITLTAREAAQKPLVQPSMNPLAQYRYLKEMEKQPEIKIKSMLDEIDDLLQAQIAGTPLAARGLRVSGSPTGAAHFSIDGQTYEAIDQVPDSTARFAIQAAIKEWEKT